MIIKIFDRQSIKNLSLFEDIIRLDIENMKEIFQRQGTGHPVEKRKKSFAQPGVIIAAFDNENLAGYIEYGPDWNNPGDIYISSFQILPKYRNTKLFGRLTRAANKDLEKKKFRNIIFGVQKTNFKMIKICEKLGFEMREREDKPSSFRISGTRIKIFDKIKYLSELVK